MGAAIIFPLGKIPGIIPKGICIIGNAAALGCEKPGCDMNICGAITFGVGKLGSIGFTVVFTVLDKSYAISG